MTAPRRWRDIVDVQAVLVFALTIHILPGLALLAQGLDHLVDVLVLYPGDKFLDFQFLEIAQRDFRKDFECLHILEVLAC